MARHDRRRRAAAPVRRRRRRGVRRGGGGARALATACGIPVVCTLMGLGIMDPEDPLYLGMLGMHGSRATNFAVDRADLLIALGVRFDDRATGSVAGFAPRARVIHMDIDEAEIGKIRRPDISAGCDVKRALRRLNRLVARPRRDAWRAEIDALRREHPADGPRRSVAPVDAGDTARGGVAPRTRIVTVDVGQHQMWAAQSWPVRRTRTFLTSGGLGTMGFALPAAMGAALAHPGRARPRADRGRLAPHQHPGAGDHRGERPGHQDLRVQQRPPRPRAPAAGAVLRQALRGVPVRLAAGLCRHRARLRHTGLHDRACPTTRSRSRAPCRSRGPLLLDIEVPETENVYPDGPARERATSRPSGRTEERA